MTTECSGKRKCFRQPQRDGRSYSYCKPCKSWHVGPAQGPRGKLSLVSRRPINQIVGRHGRHRRHRRGRFTSWTIKCIACNCAFSGLRKPPPRRLCYTCRRRQPPARSLDV